MLTSRHENESCSLNRFSKTPLSPFNIFTSHFIMRCVKILNFRRILVPDTSPCLFDKFLGYLYSGTLDKRTLSTDDVPEMLALSDKYEV